MTTRTITGTILEADDTAWASASVKFRLVSSIAADGSNTYPEYLVTATTDANGDFSASLSVPSSGAWLWECVLPSGQRFHFALEDGAATTLNAILSDNNLAAVTTAGAIQALLSAYVPLAGGTMTGALAFSGTDHAGLKVISLTTAERDALTPAAGMIIRNSTTSKINFYANSAWQTYVRRGGDSMTGDLDLGLNILKNPRLNPITATKTGGTQTLNLSIVSGAWVELTISGTVNLSITNKAAGAYLRLKIIQAAGGSHLIGSWGVDEWIPGNVAPTLTTTAGDYDLVDLIVQADGSTVLGVYGGSLTA